MHLSPTSKLGYLSFNISTVKLPQYHCINSVYRCTSPILGANYHVYFIYKGATNMSVDVKCLQN